VEGIEGAVYLRADSVKQNPSFAHPPFDSPHMALFEDFAELFKDVYPRSAQEWADGFRKDSHPEKEIAVWTAIGRAYSHFTSGKNVSPEQQRDYFRLILGCANNGPKAVLETIQLKCLSWGDAQAVIARLVKGSE
jgi:hypothetical protein